MRRLNISLQREPAISVDRISIGSLKLAYVICSDIKIKYDKGRSRIVYIGTTKNGIDRVAQSAASRTDYIFSAPKIHSFSVRIVTCTKRRNVKTWHKLERALLLEFKEMFGAIPACNTHGRNFTWDGEDQFFARTRLRAILEDLS